MKDWWILAGLGFTGGGPHLTLQWLGLHYTTAASGILYLSTTPIFIALMALPLGERLSPRQMLGVAISFTGVVIIGTHGDLAHFTFNVGDLMAVASMAMWAGYTVLLRLRRDPLEIIELLCVVCLFGIVFMTPWLVGEFFSGVKLNLTGAGALAVLYSAICSLLLAYAGWSYVVTRLGAARAGVTLHLMPAFGVILSSIFLGEYPHWFHFVGMAAILAGVFTASSASNSR